MKYSRHDSITDESTLLGVALALVGSARLTATEKTAVAGVKKSCDVELLDAVRQDIRSGLDPLGEVYCRLKRPLARRARGQTFTPDYVVEGMVAWLKRQRRQVSRIVDPGAGSGRYSIACLRAFPQAQLVAVEIDPVVSLLLRANLSVAGLSQRARVIVADFRTITLPKIAGVTAWVGNPPYVRHHDISADWKAWYSRTLEQVGHEGSQLAGLHLHFFLKTLQLSRTGDVGCYVTAAEWLDVKYGQALRQFLTNGLGGRDVFVVDPTVSVFEDAMVSAAITCFAPGSKRTSLNFTEIKSVSGLRKLSPGRPVKVSTAKAEPRWSVLVKGGRSERPAGYVELGEFFRVSRGQVTGLNGVWVAGTESPPVPSRFLVPAITNSTDITRAEEHVINDARRLKRVICLPHDFSSLDQDELRMVERFLAWARQRGADKSYVAMHRRAWWAVEFKGSAPIVMTYMGRRPPVFALNKARAPFINVAHGLYPRNEFPDQKLRQIVEWLNVNVAQEDGRVYAGGLTKFEPSEAMRILVPEGLVTA